MPPQLGEHSTFSSPLNNMHIHRKISSCQQQVEGTMVMANGYGVSFEGAENSGISGDGHKICEH